MAMSTTDADGVEAPVSDDEPSRNTHRWMIVCSSFVAAIVIISLALASRYQPIVVDGGFGSSHSNGSNAVEVAVSYNLRNTGPIGVTVIALKSGERSGSTPDTRIAPASVCPFTTLSGYDCRQNQKTGLQQGVAFHPFSLITDLSRPVLWRYHYSCNSSTEVGAAEATLTVPVTYRFLFFTHTIVLTLPADERPTCSN